MADDVKVSQNGHGESQWVKKAVASGIFTQIGQTGLKRAVGYIFEEFLPILSGRNAIRVFQEMEDNDPIVGATLFAIIMFMRKANWRIQAAGESEKDKERTKFLEECKGDMDHTWEDMISEICSMLTFGWSWQEILYKKRVTKRDKWGNAESKYNDGKVGWKSIEARSQDSWEEWEFDDQTGEVLGMWQRPPPNYDLLFIPWGKSLHFRTTSRKNNPEGKSVLRTAYRPWYYKKRMEEIEGIGVERDLAGLPMAEVPATMMREDAPEAEKAALAGIFEIVKNVRRDAQEGIVWPQEYDENGNKLYEFALLNSGGTRQFDTNGIINRYETRIAMTVLADFILLGNADTHGSFALSTSKTGMFQAALGAWMDAIASVFNQHAIPRLFRLNGDHDGPYPTIVPEDVQKPSIADLATYVSALAGAGAQLFPDTELENHLRDVARLPLRDEDVHEDTEDKIREQELKTQLELAQAREKAAKQGILPSSGGQPVGSAANGERRVQGAPTKSTGGVKSKLPPQQRRRTKAVDAGENVRKRRKLVSGAHR